MDSRSKSMVVAAFLLIGMICFVVDARLPVKRIITGPECVGKSHDKVYIERVDRLIDMLVDETKDVQRENYENYTYVQSYPNRDKGSIIGGATCDRQLYKLDCWSCLATAKNKINSKCRHTALDARIELVDCSIWVKMIR